VVGLSLAPNYNIFANWRSPTRALFGGWLSVTGTSQSWKMFAPNPPRANMFMKTVVVLKDGSAGTSATTPTTGARTRGSGTTAPARCTAAWSARASGTCRLGQLPLPRVVPRDRRAPAAVEVHKLVTKIPTPEQVATKGYYDPTKLKLTDELVETHACPLAGDIPPFMKLRRGMPLTPEEEANLAAEAREAKAAESKRRKSWANRRDWGGSGPDTNRPATPPPGRSRKPRPTTTPPRRTAATASEPVPRRTCDTPDPELTESLLRAPLQVVAEDGRRWAYKPLAMVLVSLFILYHVLVLLQHTTRRAGLAAPFSKTLAETLKAGAYMRAASNIQSWSMFAPNPHRSNMFLQVFVELQGRRRASTSSTTCTAAASTRTFFTIAWARSTGG
jgi:hypothetical protein